MPEQRERHTNSVSGNHQQVTDLNQQEEPVDPIVGVPIASGYSTCGHFSKLFFFDINDHIGARSAGQQRPRAVTIAPFEPSNRETVTRNLSQQENQLLLQGYRQAILRIVPDTLVGLSYLVNQLDRTAIIETLYGAKVLMDRHEVETKGVSDIDAAQCASHVCHGATFGRPTRVPREKPCSRNLHSRSRFEKRAAVLFAGTNSQAARRTE